MNTCNCGAILIALIFSLVWLVSFLFLFLNYKFKEIKWLKEDMERNQKRTDIKIDELKSDLRKLDSEFYKIKLEKKG